MGIFVDALFVREQGKKGVSGTDSQRRHIVNGWFSSKLCLLKLGTEFSFQMSTLEAEQGKCF